MYGYSNSKVSLIRTKTVVKCLKPIIRASEHEAVILEKEGLQFGTPKSNTALGYLHVVPNRRTKICELFMRTSEKTFSRTDKGKDIWQVITTVINQTG